MKPVTNEVTRSLTSVMIGLAWVLSVGACAAEEGPGFQTGPTMRPGENCRRCHGSVNSDFPDAPEWTAAGTVYPGPDSPATDGVPFVRVILSDPDGGVIESLLTNAVGNFFTDTPLPAGYRVALEYEGERIDMPCAPPSGGCAACHTQPPIGNATGRIFLPQAPESADVNPECQGFDAP